MNVRRWVVNDIWGGFLIDACYFVLSSRRFWKIVIFVERNFVYFFIKKLVFGFLFRKNLVFSSFFNLYLFFWLFYVGNKKCVYFFLLVV